MMAVDTIAEESLCTCQSIPPSHFALRTHFASRFHFFILFFVCYWCEFLADGKDGSPMGVVRCGGVHIVCSIEAQWN